MSIPYEVILNVVLSLVLTSDIKEIVDVIELVMRLIDMLFEALQLEIYFEPFLTTDKTIGFFILSRGVTFLSQLSEFVNDGT